MTAPTASRSSLAAQTVSACLLIAVLLAWQAAPDAPREESTPPRPAAVSPAAAAPAPIVLPAPPARPAPAPRPQAEAEVAAPATPAPAPPEKMAAASAAQTTGPAPVEVQQAEPAIAIDPETVAEGRITLQMIAAGKGPAIEIAWPDGAAERERLYARLSACHGLKNVVVTADGAVYANSGPRGEPWRLNRDAYSPFLRLAEGRLPPREAAEIAAIHQRHGISGAAGRLFPRAVDAGIIGALLALTPAKASQHLRIQARYILAGNGITVTDIRVNGERAAQSIRLPAGFANCVVATH